MTRIADLTWKHPKLVLAAVAAFVAAARSPSAATSRATSRPPASPTRLGERAGDAAAARLARLRPQPGDRAGRPQPRRRAARPQRPRRAPRGRPAQPRDGAGRVRRPGRQPAARPRDRRTPPDRRATANRWRSPATSRPRTSRTTAASPPKAVEPLVASSSLDVAMGGFAPGFNEVNDQTREDLTKAELIAFPILALLLLFVFRGVVAAAIPLLIGVISIVGTLLVLRVMSSFVDTSLFALNIATGLSLGLAVDYALLMVSRYREEIGARRRDPRGPPAHGADGRPHGGLLRPHRRRRDGGAGRHAAALPLLDGGRRRLGRRALGADRDPRRALAAGPARHPDRRALDPPRPGGLRRPPTAGTGWPAA